MNAKKYENKGRELEEAVRLRYIVSTRLRAKKRVRAAHNVMLCQAGVKSK